MKTTTNGVSFSSATRPLSDLRDGDSDGEGGLCDQSKAKMESELG